MRNKIKSRPCRRTEGLPGGKRIQRCAISVGGVRPDRVAPPVKCEASLGVLHREEDDHDTQGDASVQSGRQNVVVAHPPSEVVAPDQKVEHEPGEGPGRVVYAGRGGDALDAGEEDRDVDISPEGEGVATGEEVEWHGQNGTDEEEVQQRGISRKKDVKMGETGA